MGSLGSRPRAPEPTPVYVPVLPTAPPPAPVPPTPTPEETAAGQRTQNLLRRSRGRFGTVQTGFRGLLELGSGQGRKTLLGE